MKFRNVFAVFVICIPICDGTGTLELTLDSYKNPSKRNAAGDCCYPRSTRRCGDKCKNVFSICYSFENVGACDSKSLTSGAFYEDDITFQTTLGNGLSNPLKIPFNEWKGLFFVNVTVVNIIDGKNDLIGVFTRAFSSNLQSLNIKKSVTLKRGDFMREKEFSFSIRATCDNAYLLPDCSTQRCVSQDDAFGHFTCINETKVCLPGWRDVSTNCTRRNNSVHVTSIKIIRSAIQNSVTSILSGHQHTTPLLTVTMSTAMKQMTGQPSRMSSQSIYITRNLSRSTLLASPSTTSLANITRLKRQFNRTLEPTFILRQSTSTFQPTMSKTSTTISTVLSDSDKAIKKRNLTALVVILVIGIIGISLTIAFIMFRLRKVKVRMKITPTNTPDTTTITDTTS